MYALFITTDNAIKVIDYPDDFDFDWVRSKIGCGTIERVCPEKLPRGYILLIDESGKLKPNHINPICSWLYGYEHHGDPIVGNALLIKEDYIDGEIECCGLSDEDVEKLITLLTEGRK